MPSLLFVLLNTYLKPLDEVDRVLPEHRVFQDAMYERGIFIVSGRREPRTGGVTLARAASARELEALLQDDPFVRNGITRYEIVPFVPTRWSEAFGPALAL